jgi:two-component system catabolic regulation response regulator CreB
MNKKEILIFEDEASIAETLIYALVTDGFSVQRVVTGSEGLKILEHKKIDLIVLDVGLPDMNGFEVCKIIRKKSQTPIFFLTARSSEVDKVVGLEIGADDYITKPFSPREVSARVKAIFRRLEGRNEHEIKNTKSSFIIDESKYKIFFRNSPLNLTKYEYGLLKTLLKRPGQVYSREQLMQIVWSDPEMSLERTVDSHIKSLRMKLKENESSEIIITHRGIGYSINEDQS